MPKTVLGACFHNMNSNKHMNVALYILHAYSYVVLEKNRESNQELLWQFSNFFVYG